MPRNWLYRNLCALLYERFIFAERLAASPFFGFTARANLRDLCPAAFGATACYLARRKASCTSHLRRNVRVAAKARHVHCTQLPFPKYTYRVPARAHMFFLVPARVAHDVPHADKTVQDRIVAVVLAHLDAIV